MTSDVGKTSETGEPKPWDWDAALPLLREAVAPYPPAALFALSEDGYATLFEVVVGCILSIRTRDEDLMRIAPRLFASARTPKAIADLDETELIHLISGTQFPEPKAKQIQMIARIALENNGELSCDLEDLLALPGVGPKCAHLSRGIACGIMDGVPVDVHVFRVTNRWGIVQAKTPEKTADALQEVTPAPFRLELNRLLVPFGKHVCTANRPKCGVCLVRDRCKQVGVLVEDRLTGR